MIKVVKKDGTLEDFNVQKVVDAVNKSACRVLINFTEEEEKFICQFVEEKVFALGIDRIEIAQMHNIVEGALERVNPVVAKSYRDYRNYKQDFVQMLDDVYTKSQSTGISDGISKQNSGSGHRYESYQLDDHGTCDPGSFSGVEKRKLYYSGRRIQYSTACDPV